MREAVVVNGLLEEGISRRFIKVLGKHKINGIAEFINSAIQVNPFALDFNIGFIHLPGRCNRARLSFLAASAKDDE
jgi:hypothetical protein